MSNPFNVLPNKPLFSKNVLLVGGAVRDKLLGREPKDHDYVIVGATDADVEAMCNEGYTQVGADFPVFLHPTTGEEYALARIERKSGAGYHGFIVQADESVTIEDDLARRDLTVNSMAMDDAGQVIDPYGGVRDMHNHVLRHTTEAFAEDPLRVLRLARFAARFSDWTVAPETIELCKKIGEAGELNHLTIERVWVEMEKGFSEVAPHRFMEVLEETKALENCGVLTDIFMPFNETDHKLAKALACVPQEHRLFVSIGVLGHKNLATRGGPARAQDCYANVSEMLVASRTAVDLYKVLKKARALQSGPQFEDLVMAATVFERAGKAYSPFSAKTLLMGQHILQGVRAAEFPGVEGKELGQAIEQARIAKLAEGLSIPM